MLKFLLWRRINFRSINRKRIDFSRRNIEPNEIFLDLLAQEKEKELGIPEKRFEVSLSKKILKISFAFIVVLIFVFFVKSFQMQIIKHQKYLALAEENKFVSRLIQAFRGIIYDSKGKQLVFNEQSFDLILDKKKIPSSIFERNKVLKEVSKIVNQDVNDLKKKIASSQKQIIPILENIDHQTLILLETKINSLPGFKIKRNFARRYVDPEIFSHLIGYMGKITAEEWKQNSEFYTYNDYIGRDGLEKRYEEFLRKSPGEIQIERDAHGRLMSKKVVSMPEPGKSLVLWIDSDLQRKAQEALKKIFKKTKTSKGVVVALNPKNGGVLALVNVPSFDNNLFNKKSDQKSLEKLLKDPQKPFLNRAIAGLYPTGSTVKPLIASAALEEKIISPLKKIHCKGEIVIPNKYNPKRSTIKHDWTIHGWTDMRKAIAESCNVYFYTIGGGYKEQKGLGPSKIKKYLELFGWGDKTGIDLPGESKGLIPSPEWKRKVKKTPWWDGDTYNLAIGQGDILITPIEVAASFVAIANGGTLYRPRVVKEIIDSQKRIIKTIAPEVIRSNFIKPQNLKVVREGMRQAVTGKNSPLASSVLLNSLPVAAAAKTGTAETPKPGYYHNWVTVFAPYDDPQIVLTVMIENVKGLKSAALPVAKEILEWYFKDKAKNKTEGAKSKS